LDERPLRLPVLSRWVGRRWTVGSDGSGHAGEAERFVVTRRTTIDQREEIGDCDRTVHALRATHPPLTIGRILARAAARSGTGNPSHAQA
jgi:hypothetical protein